MRELHWHPNASEWQFFIAGKGRMTVFMPVGLARTMDCNANDVGFVPAMAGHYIQNTGDTDLVTLEMFKAKEVLDFSLTTTGSDIFLRKWLLRTWGLTEMRSRPFQRKSWRNCRDRASQTNAEEF